MKIFLKILLLLVAVFPIWLTIAAFSAESEADQATLKPTELKATDLKAADLRQADPKQPDLKNLWKDRLNSKLLLLKDDSKRIQIVDLSFAPNQNLEKISFSRPFDLDLSAIKPTGISPLEVRFKDQEGRLEDLVRLNAKLFIQERMPVATRTLSKGVTIAAGDYKMEWRDSSAIQTSALHSESFVLGRVLRFVVQDGDIFRENSFQEESLVSRGDRVKVNVVGKGLVISTTAVAEEGGSKGQTIRVLNIDSRKEILAVVVDSRVVEVRL